MMVTFVLVIDRVGHSCICISKDRWTRNHTHLTWSIFHYAVISLNYLCKLLMRTLLHLTVADLRVNWLLPLNQLLLHHLLLHILLLYRRLHGLLLLYLVGLHIHLLHLNHLAGHVVLLHVHMLLLHVHILLTHVRWDWLRDSVAQRGAVIETHWLLLLLLLLLHVLLVYGWAVVEMLVLVIHFYNYNNALLDLHTYYDMYL